VSDEQAPEVQGEQAQPQQGAGLAPEQVHAGEPSIESGSFTAEGVGADPGLPTPDEAVPAEAQAQPQGDAQGADEQSDADAAPAEGFDGDATFIKQYNLASSAPLHELSADEIAQHPQTYGLPDAAARAARDQGYAPTGPAQLVHSEPDGDKSALTFAVPVEPRNQPQPETAPAEDGETQAPAQQPDDTRN